MTEAIHERPPEEPIRRVPQLDGERAISPVAGRFGASRGGKLLTLAALVVGGGVFVAATWTHPHRQKSGDDPGPARQVVPYEGPKPPDAPTVAHATQDPNAPSLSSSTSAPGGVGASGGPAASQVAAGSTSSGGTAEAQKQAALAEASRRAPLMAYSGGQSDATRPDLGAPAVASAAEKGSSTELDQLRRGSAIGLARAARLPDRNFLIVAGASIPCVLQTAMDTAAPGYVTCVVPQDVFSDNGAVVLLEKGTRVLGEYRSGMRQGQHRLFVLWNRAVTPQGVAIALASPASDSLGRAGFDGSIDTHFWARFGGALLLSVVDGATTAVAGGSSRYPGVVQLPSDAAGIAVQNSIDIPPTLRKPQGSEVAILVAQDLDFSGVYGLKAR